MSGFTSRNLENRLFEGLRVLDAFVRVFTGCLFVVGSALGRADRMVRQMSLIVLFVTPCKDMTEGKRVKKETVRQRKQFSY